MLATCQRPAVVGETVDRRIERVSPGTGTTVLKFGGACPLHLRVNGDVTVPELARYCADQAGWDVAGMPVALDGRLVDNPATAVVTGRTSTVEFRARAGAKG